MQYSNPIAILEREGVQAFGASFTLGEGNRMLCEAADFIVRQLEGVSVADLILSGQGFYETLTNPLQLRWLSPNAGVPLMAAGLIVNTLIDGASKACALPAWEFLSRLPSEFLLGLMPHRHLGARHGRHVLKEILDEGLQDIDGRCDILRRSGLPVYYTTWIGHDADSIAAQIGREYACRGIRTFKVKISSDIRNDSDKLRSISQQVPPDVTLCVDANQTLSLDEAMQWMPRLSELGVMKHLRPELLNRIDETVVFHQLRKKDLAGIVEIQVGNLRKRLKARGLDLELTPAAVNALADEGYDPAFGARPLKRVIQQRLENPIAERMLKGEFTDGETVRVDCVGKSFVVGKGAARVGVST